MKIKNDNILTTLNVLNNQAPLEKAPKGVYGLAKNLSKLKAASEAIEASRKALWKEHFGEDTEIKPDDKRLPAFQDAFRQVLETETEVEPHKIKYADLNTEVNKISAKDLEAMLWFIED